LNHVRENGRMRPVDGCAASWNPASLVTSDLPIIFCLGTMFRENRFPLFGIVS